MWDFQYYLGLDFIAMLKGSHSPKQVIALISQLPLESNTISALRGGEQFVGWGIDRYHFAQLIDAVNSTTHAVVASNSKRKPKAPKPLPRPKKNNGRGENNIFRKKLQAAKNKPTGG